MFDVMIVLRQGCYSTVIVDLYTTIQKNAILGVSIADYFQPKGKRPPKSKLGSNNIDILPGWKIVMVWVAVTAALVVPTVKRHVNVPVEI